MTFRHEDTANMLDKVHAFLDWGLCVEYSLLYMAFVITHHSKWWEGVLIIYAMWARHVALPKTPSKKTSLQ